MSRVVRQFYETPHLDRLMREGTAFTQAYACQLCAPTRAGLPTRPNAAKFCEFAMHTPFQATPEDTAYYEQKPTRGGNDHSFGVRSSG